MENLTSNQRTPEPNLASKIQSAVEEIWLRAIRLYTYNTPIDKGKHRLYHLALQLCRHLPTATPITVRDGRKLSVNLTTGMHTTVFFFGEYEEKVTKIVASLIRKGDVCLDVGANFGWYTTLFHKQAGMEGEVHAFEPIPETFIELTRNYELMNKPKNIFINNLALGNRQGEVTINLFAGLATGHASLSQQGRNDFTSFQCQMITLDSYLETHNLNQVNFVKVDIEGAEMIFLQGAERLFKQRVPPIWLMEMALKQTRNFGYLPTDLINFLQERAAYDFYAVEESKGTLRKIAHFAPDDIGANVICIPKEYYQDRISSTLSDFRS